MKMEIDIAAISKDYLEGKNSLSDLRLKYGVSMSTLRRRLIAYGTNLRSHCEALDYARHKLGSGNRGKTRNFTEEHKKNISKAKRFKKNSIKMSEAGYLRCSGGPGRTKGAHVLVMQEYLGREMRKGEIVHHIDHDKTNNSIHNLALLTKKGHIRLHCFQEQIANYNRIEENIKQNKGEKR